MKNYHKVCCQEVIYLLYLLFIKNYPLDVDVTNFIIYVTIERRLNLKFGKPPLRPKRIKQDLNKKRENHT